MLEWLKTWLGKFQAWLDKTVTDAFKWFFDKIEAAYHWVLELVKKIVQTAWDMMMDAVSWVLEQVLDIVKTAVQAVDVSAFDGIASGLQIPPEILNILSLIGIPQALGIIVAAIGIRLLLQLIPFTRLGS